MKKNQFITYLIPLLVVATLIFLYIREHNDLTELRIQVPKLEREISSLEAEKIKLQFELEQFFSPSRLEEISRRAQYAHLKQLEPSDCIDISPCEPKRTN